MPKKLIIGLVIVLVLALAAWLVPLALAAAGAGQSPAPNASPGTHSGTTHQCPAGGSWNGSGGSGANSGTSFQ